MKIYLAARFGRILELREYAKHLEFQGHEITSRWLQEGAEASYEELTPARARQCAEYDIADIYKSHCVISFTESRNSGYTSGGRHVEFGIALALGKTCYIVGPLENVFHHLTVPKWFLNWNACKDHCARIAEDFRSSRQEAIDQRKTALPKPIIYPIFDEGRKS